MEEKYEHLAVEKAAQTHWNTPAWNGHDAYRVSEGARNAQGALKPKYYACSMLPSPAASCTWAMCATTPSTTCSRATCA